MSERFFVDHPIEAHATLDGPEAHHLLHVMRGGVGDEVTLFDGGGAEFTARVTAATRSRVELEVVQRREISRERPTPIAIAAALPKGDRQRWMVEKLTELGVTRLVPIETERSVAKLSENARAKLRRAVVEASKQCRRNRLMAIEPPAGWAELLAETPPTSQRWIAHPTANRQAIDATLSGGVTIAIGPEGGFTDGEIDAALSAGWRAIDFGPRILRTETAAIAAAAWASIPHAE